MRANAVRRVALTGATGFIGRHLALALQRAGIAVRALVRPESRNISKLPPGCETRVVRLAEDAGIAGALAGADAVVYCAGSVRGARYQDFEAANVQGVAHIAAALAASAPATPLLLMSSLAASRPHVSPYARSKFEGEQAVRGASISWSILRPPPVYGPEDREMRALFVSIHRGLAPVLGPPGQRLSLLHVEDLARACLAWLDNVEACRGQVYAIDDGRERGYDWQAIIEEVKPGTGIRIRVPRTLLAAIGRVNLLGASLFGYAPMLTPGKVTELWQDSWLCDNSAFSAATGWTPRIRLKEGTQRLFEWGRSDKRLSRS
jgi:nucleoside-diphosphate-sugar epimerase